MTSGPIPSPGSTAMWRALFADMEFPGWCGLRIVIPGWCVSTRPGISRFRVRCCASPRNDGLLRRQYRAADQPALLQIDERIVGLGKRHRRDWNGCDLLGAYEIEQFLSLAEIADIAALDRHGLDRNQRQRPRRAAAEQADDDKLATFGQAVEPELRGLGVADQVDHGADRAAGFPGQLLQRVGGSAIDGGKRAGLLRGFPLARIDINDDGALAAHRFEQRQRHQAKTARTENDDRRVEGELDFLQRAVGGDAGARVRRGGDGIEALQVEEILWMRHDHVVGIAAIAIDAEGTGLDDAHVLVAAKTRLALAAAAPGT